MGIIYSSQSLASDGSNTSQDTECRIAPRIQTILRVGRIIADKDEGLVRIKNISDHGARLRLNISVMLGDTLTLEISEGVTMTGIVVWISGDDCGFQFDHHIDCGELLANLAACAKQGVSRPVRLPVATSAVTRGENGIRLAKVTDVSQRGMKLRHDGSFTEGLHVKITLPSGLERCGVVRWSNDNIAGVMLLEPFSPEELGSARNL